MGRVSFDDVKKVYGSSEGDIVAVEDLSLDVSDGEFLVLVGPSGCGKSTTLRMVAGLEDITDGRISIGDHVVNGTEPRERDIAMVFQNYALYPHMTVRENIGFGLKYSSDLSKEEIDDRVENVAEMMDIPDLLADKPSQLSGGQRQRVALGRAIVREPQVFLFDEPLSNLDAKLRTHMRTEITRLQRELDVTSIYVTHDQAEAMTMADVVAVMNDGILQQAAPPNEVYNHPANQFVAGFIGSPSMNFLEMRLDQHGGRHALVGRENESVSYGLDDTVVERTGIEVGDHLTLGVRPEDLDVARDPSQYDADRLLTATVDVVEPMGSDNFLTLLPQQGESWVARVDSSYAPEEGGEVVMTFDPGVLHLFARDGTTLKSQGTGNDAYHAEEYVIAP
ncbi:sugar ABC transporter ATP-binding protein [Salinigranum rubrum]|uniref:ABC-type D-xylose/L-arabinose transporter n=1 Tax=Salinigranum rubrum TaxID=755307 RepID=A0A2I8VFZ1_9EURY|nr:sn-glycerol-3-phosphate ABC transporter ATP-binding protein UgpC [Salinigranum rubrum]AUV80835.1 sugar ABC transporter ATP-binding protein [Salinigranum rubrum]